MGAKKSRINPRSNSTIERTLATLVNDHQNRHNRISIISSIIRAWATSNKISNKELEKSKRLAAILTESPAGSLENEILQAVSVLTLKQVEVCFENLIDSGRKRSEGVVYTPDYIIDYIIKYCIRHRSKKSVPTLIDPACGGGGFIIRAIPLIAAHYKISYEEVITHFVRGMDINADAVDCARLSLDLFCAEMKLSIREPLQVFLRGDSLLSSPEEIWGSFNRTTGFDIVCTNPPYVKLQNLDLEYRANLSRKFEKFANGSFSLAMLFLLSGHQLLSKHGILGYITQNNFFTSLAAEAVREHIQRNSLIHSVIDFEHAKIFNNASAYTCLLFLDNVRKEKLSYIQIKNPEKDIPTLKDNVFHPISIHGLNNKKWRLTDSNHQKNLESLEHFGNPLAAIANIRVGFATLKDSVFWVNTPELHDLIEKEITLPAIKISDFSDEQSLRQNSRRIIRPYKKINKKWVSLSEPEFRELYPNAYNHLLAHRNTLESRDKGKKPTTNFFEWGRTQGMEAIGPKLLTKTFSKGPNFLLDHSDSLFCNGYSITPKASDSDFFSSNIDIHCLQIILNSKIMEYYSKLTSFQLHGGYQCFQKNFIERFSIPEIGAENVNLIKNLPSNEREILICDIFKIQPDIVLNYM